MRIILVTLAFLCPALAAQEAINLDGLSSEQVLQLKTQAENMKETKDLDKAKQWVEFGEMIGKAIGSTAKELNVAVNEFVQTPVGKMALVLIVWKVAGREVFKFGLGFLWLVFGVILWHRTFWRWYAYKSIDYGKGWWIFRAKKIEMNQDAKECQVSLMIVSIIVIIGSSQIVMWAGS